MTKWSNGGEPTNPPVEVDAGRYVGWCPACGHTRWTAVETMGTTARVVPACDGCQRIHPGVLFLRGTDPARDRRDLVLDFRGRQIVEGVTVVYAGAGGRLLSAVVRGLDFKQRPSWWVNVRIGPGGSTTPDRLAVI